MKYTAMIVIGLVLHVLACRIPIAPGITVPLAGPVLMVTFVTTAAALIAVIRYARRFRSSPSWRRTWPQLQPVAVPSRTA